MRLLIATPLMSGSQTTFLKADKPSNKIQRLTLRKMLLTKIGQERGGREEEEMCFYFSIVHSKKLIDIC